MSEAEGSGADDGDGSGSTGDDARVQQSQGVTDVTVIRGRDRLGRRRTKSVGGVIVLDQAGVAVRIIAAEMAPIERTACDKRGQHGRHDSAK